jgi:predicted KAP-like P-loop ATPase
MSIRGAIRGWLSRRSGSSSTSIPQNEAKALPELKAPTTEEKGSPGPKSENLAESGYSSDQPIRSKDQDRFNRWPFAKRIADTLSGRRDPSSLVIGIYGAWGEGKSSVLTMMRQALADDGHVVCVSFNPWHFGSDEQLLRSFFKTLAAALGKSVSTKLEGIGKHLERYGSILSAATVTVGGVVQLDPGNAAKAVGEALSTVELDKHRIRIEQILRNAGKRVVVLVDDIDRLDRHEIQTIFKLVKLSANFEYTSYVLAFDDEMVAEALGDKYGGGGVEAGRSFLEKIVQVPLNLPPADSLALRRLVFEGIESALNLSGIDVSDEQGERFAQHFIDGIGPGLTTPRHANLYVNALTFALPIMKGEVSPIDQMLIEGIRVFYPKLYATIRDHGEEFLRMYRDGREDDASMKAVVDMIDAGLEGVSTKDRKQIRRGLLEVLFPRLKGGYGSEWDGIWKSAKRVCSDAYFERYFRYGIPLDDVSDLAVDDFVESIKTSTEDETEKAFKALATQDCSRRLIQKIRNFEDDFSQEAAARLAVTVARNGSVLAREKGMIVSDWTFMQGAVLVAMLLKRIPDGEGRQALARRLLAEVEPLPFAIACVSWMRRSKDEEESERLLSDAVLNQLWQLVARRIGAAAAEAPLYRTFGRDAQTLYSLWNTHAETAGDVAKHLKERFDSDPSDVEQFLSMFVGTSWEMETGIPRRSEFDREDYDALIKLIDPEIVLSKLRERFGAQLDTPGIHHPVDTPLRDRLAEQFAYVHRKAKEEKKQKASAESLVAPAQ